MCSCTITEECKYCKNKRKPKHDGWIGFLDAVATVETTFRDNNEKARLKKI